MEPTLIEGCMAGYSIQSHNQLHGTEYQKVLEELEIILREHPTITQQLGYLDNNLNITKYAKSNLIVGLDIQYHKCYGNIPKWKLDWYKNDFKL